MNRSSLWAAALLLVLPPGAHGHFWNRTYAARYYAAPVVVAAYPVAVPAAVPVYAPPRPVFYEPAPVYVEPACLPPVPAVAVVPSASAFPQTAPPPLAVPPADEPAPLPPSKSSPAAPTTPPAEPPSSTTIMTSAARLNTTSFYDAYPVAPRAGDPPAGDRSSICFWNLSGADVTLTVAGRTQTLPRGGRARFALDRQFVWQVGGREPRREDVPAGAAGLEVVLRR